MSKGQKPNGERVLGFILERRREDTYSKGGDVRTGFVGSVDSAVITSNQWNSFAQHPLGEPAFEDNLPAQFQSCGTEPQAADSRIGALR